jgi:hypothetical protein
MPGSPSPRSTTPYTVVAAALCVAGYGVSVCLGEFTLAGPAGTMPSPLLRLGIILALASCTLAGGLWLRARWAWFAALAFASWFTLSGLLSILKYARSGGMQAALAPSGVVLFAIGVASITGALVLLILPRTRAAFRDGAV